MLNIVPLTQDKYADWDALYDYTDIGNHKLMEAGNRNGMFIAPCGIPYERIYRQNKQDQYVSISTYTRHRAQERDIYAVCMVAVDVDSPYDAHIADSVIYFLQQDKGIPSPTYIEYGRHWRLVWALQTPYMVHDNASNGKQRQSRLTLLKRLTRTLTDAVKDILQIHDWDMSQTAEPHKLTSFVRVPGSVNSKDGSTIEIRMTGDKVDTDRLIDILPPLPDWYPAWKAKQKQNKSSCMPLVDRRSLTDRRIDDLKRIQRLPKYNGIGYRETLTYLYWLTCLQAGMSDDQAEQAAKDYNNGFNPPLTVSNCMMARPRSCNGKPAASRRYKDSTIRQMLDLSEAEAKQEGVLMGMTNAESKRRYNNRIRHGKTYQDEMDAKARKVVELRDKGVTVADICKIMGICKQTCITYTKRGRALQG